MTCLCSQKMMRFVGLLSDVILLHPEKRMSDTRRIPVWREFCPGFNHICIFVFSYRKIPRVLLLKLPQFGNVVDSYAITGIISASRKTAKGTRNPHWYPFSSLATPHESHQGIDRYVSFAGQHHCIWCQS